MIFGRKPDEPAASAPAALRGEQMGTWWVIAPDSDSIDYDTADRFRREVLASIEAGRRRIAVDMTSVRLVDSMGLGSLVAIRKKLEGSGDIRLFGLTRDLHTFFEVTKTAHLFPAYSTLRDLLAAP